MKNVARAFALSLVVTGAFASTHLNSVSGPAIHAKVSAMPVPSCPLNSPTNCGICKVGSCSVGN